MEKTLFQHFNSFLGVAPRRDFFIDLSGIRIEPLDLQELDIPFMAAELLGAITQMPLNKAPGPDGFIVEFYCAAWPIIGNDVTLATCAFAAGDRRGLNHLNNAFVTLLRKRENAAVPLGFRPISLIHSIDKIITKALEIRLALRLSSLITNYQSASISSRSIHENFKLVHSTAQLLKKSKCPKILFKLDITKEFDTVSWPFLLEVLRVWEFGHRWCS